MPKIFTFTTLGVVILLIVTFYFFQRSNNKEQTIITKKINMENTLTLKSKVFEDNAMIPAKYTCDGENIIPSLEISGIPPETKSLVLIMDDPDAPMGTFVHWVKWNIPTTTSEIKENTEPSGISGKGGSGKLTYIGPCPPSGVHHYHFKLYALDTTLSLPEGSNKQKVEQAMNGHIINQAELIGLYKKQNTN
jgi:Raf kinase inhibitor-like YbhB/YbcL family protein